MRRLRRGFISAGNLPLCFAFSNLLASFWYLFISILCSLIFSQGYLGRTEGSSSRRGLGGSIWVLGAGLIKAWLVVAGARDNGAE